MGKRIYANKHERLSRLKAVLYVFTGCWFHGYIDFFKNHSIHLRSAYFTICNYTSIKIFKNPNYHNCYEYFLGLLNEAFNQICILIAL